MNLSLKSIAERLRVARETTGMSTRVVARKLKERGFPVSHTSLANYETVKLPPPVALIDALADLYGRSREWFLSSGPMLSGIRYRALKAVKVGDKRAFEGEALGWFQAYLAAEKAVHDPIKHVPADFRVKPSETGAEVARWVRDADVYRFGDYPIPSIMRLAENFGIRVIQLHTDARIDGIAARLGDVSVVAINQNLSNDRIRMNAAHELGHHLFQDCVDGSSLSDEEADRRAMEFASHLLIPDAALREAFGLQSMVRLIQYKERYGISLAAMLYRAEQGRLLPRGLSKTLWIKFGQLGWRRDEPGYVPPDRPIRMESLFDAAVQQKKMTFAQIAAVAGVDERAVRRRVFLAMGGSAEAFEPRRIRRIFELTHTSENCLLKRSFNPMSPKKHICDLLDRETEKPALEKLYLRFRVATDQLRRCPEVLGAIADGFERLVSRRIDPGTLLRYMFNRRKAADWPKLGEHAKRFSTSLLDLLPAACVDSLKRIYVSINIPLDEYIFRPKLGAELAHRYVAETGSTESDSVLVAVMMAYRKRGNWPTIREATAEKLRPFGDIDEVARRYAAGA